MKANKILKFACLCLLLCICFVSCDDGEVYRSWEDDDAHAAYKDEGEKKTDKDETTSAKKDGYSKYVALTFDDGPHNTRTKKIVDALDKYGYNATFFVVGNRVDGSEYNGAEAMKYAAQHGNEIAIHAYTHSLYYDTCTDASFESELSKTATAINKAVPSVTPRLMRPVGGRITNERVSSCQYSVIMWSVDSEDWKLKNGDVNEIVENVMSEVRDGSIILMHDIYENTAEAVPLILERLRDEGYGVVTVSELIGKDLMVGKKYSNG